MQAGQRVRARRPIRSGRIVIAKGTVGTVAGKHGFFSAKYSVRFATAKASAVVRDVSERDLVPVIIAKRGTKGRR